MISQDLSYVLEKLRTDVPGVVSAVALSADGLVQASSGIDRDQADKFAAAGAGLISLLRGFGQMLGAALVTNLTQMDSGHLLATPMSDGAALLVFADLDTDLAAAAYQMQVLANAAGHALTPRPREAMTGAQV